MSIKTKNGLTEDDKRLLRLVDTAVAHADSPGNSEDLRLNPVPGNPPFRAQFDIQFLIKYFSVAAGVFTAKTAAQILAADGGVMATQLPAFVFGQSDFQGGFKKSRQQFALSGWAYYNPFIYGKDVPGTPYGDLDATGSGALQVGDLVEVFYASPGATDYIALVIVRCNQVAYGTLLDSLSSDRFWINNLRYILTDTSAAGLLQFDNEIKIQKQSLFGLFNENSVSPTSNKLPTQFQDGILDVPIDQGVDKNVIFGMYLNYDAVNLKWSIFVRNFDRVQA